MPDKIVFSLNPSVVSPTFIATADLHIGKKLYNMPELEEDLRNNLSRLVDLAIDKKVDYLIEAGDLFEDNFAKADRIGFVVKEVERLKNHNIKMVGIAGDHDKPSKDECWYKIARLDSVNIDPSFSGIDYFDYSTVEPEDIVSMLKEHKDPSKILWIFLHCQFPQIFQRAEPKKTIDFNRLKLFENFPNIQGIIAGDVHFAPETRAYGVGREAYVGYPGSLGVNDISEITHDKHVLYCDGKSLMHIPFPQLRSMRKIDFRGKTAEEFDVDEQVEWAKSLSMKPVFHIIWDIDSDHNKYKLHKLYECGLVREQQLQLGAKESTDDGGALTTRSDVSSDDKIEKALRDCCEKDDELFKLSYSLLKNDPKEILDKFKNNYTL